VFLAFAMIMAVGAATGGPYDLLEPLSPWWQLVAGGSALAYALGRLAPALLRTYRTLVLVSADEDEVTLLTRRGLVHLRRGSAQNVTLRPVGRTHAVLVVERNGTPHELAIEAEGLTAAELAETLADSLGCPIVNES
jgi:hypothetical protein